MENKITATGNHGLAHLKELDALRAFAVLLVLLAHYIPEMGTEIPFLWYGVDIFFTISGFLITAILLYALEKNHHQKKIRIAGNFMVRRVLRLFPLYYLFITLFWLLKKYGHLQLWKDDFTVYFFTYTPNILFYQKGLAYGSYFAHLWSLGVEEQFYLLWPWLILFISDKLRKPMILILILVAFVSLGIGTQGIHLLPFANFHTLGIGALLACFYKDNNDVLEWLKQNRMIIAMISCINLLVLLIFFEMNSVAGIIYQAFSVSICTAALVLVSIFGWKGFIGKITTGSFIRYIGRISYGIYLLHFVVPPLLVIALKKLNVELSSSVQFVLYFPIVFGLAALSYQLIELPFLRLKNSFKD